jgi:hypothetical protein
MRRHTVGLLTCAAATIALAAFVSSADAGKLEVSAQQFRVTWNAMTFSEASTTIVCKVTLEGSFHQRTFTKTPQSLLGFITRASSAACTGGGVASPLPTTLPWHVRYVGFTGNLPNINGFQTQIISMSFGLTYTFVECLIRTEPVEPAEIRWGREMGGSVLSAEWRPTLRIIQTGLFCGEALLGLSNPGEVFILNTTSRFRLRLI